MSTAELLKQATDQPKNAESIYRQVLNVQSTPQNDQTLKDQQTALVELGRIYRDSKNADGLAEIVTLSRSYISATAKAKTANLIRTLLDYFSAVPDSQSTQIAVLRTNITWANSEKRLFLAHSLETRLVSLLISTQQYKPAIALIDTLLSSLKRLDDKLILTEVHLLESKVYRAIGNLAKSKAALTSARTAANAIYCPPHMQAGLDLQSGILHAEEKDYGTAYSYFFETFENLETQVGETDKAEAINALKYMMLCKIMLNAPEDVTALLATKLALPYTGHRSIASMRAVARAHKNRSLTEFEAALRDYQTELSSDPTTRTHLAALYDTLLEQNLLRIVEPYSVVDLEWVARGVGQGRQGVEVKLSQMILDKVLYGVLDQGRGCLLVFEKPEQDETYSAAIDTLDQVGKVVESLYAKSVKIA